MALKAHNILNMSASTEKEGEGGGSRFCNLSEVNYSASRRRGVVLRIANNHARRYKT